MNLPGKFTSIRGRYLKIASATFGPVRTEMEGCTCLTAQKTALKFFVTTPSTSIPWQKTGRGRYGRERPMAYSKLIKKTKHTSGTKLPNRYALCWKIRKVTCGSEPKGLGSFYLIKVAGGWLSGTPMQTVYVTIQF